MDQNALERSLAENPLPPRAFMLMKEYELKLLHFHKPAVEELERRRKRKIAKKQGDVLAMQATAPPTMKGKTDELTVRVAQPFGYPVEDGAA